jgi:hypothetical protein
MVKWHDKMHQSCGGVFYTLPSRSPEPGDFEVICNMRTRIPLTIFFLIAYGCSEPPSIERADVVSVDPMEATRTEYKTLTERPDVILDSTRSSYPNKFDKFHDEWIETASAVPLDGQRAIELLEVACYADVVCHPTEYPLRVATLDYIEQNMRSADVLNALKWVSVSYKSGLPLDEPNDESGQMRGILVNAMNIRMVDYAKDLLDPETPSQHRK